MLKKKEWINKWCSNCVGTTSSSSQAPAKGEGGKSGDLCTRSPTEQTTCESKEWVLEAKGKISPSVGGGRKLILIGRASPCSVKLEVIRSLRNF